MNILKVIVTNNILNMQVSIQSNEKRSLMSPLYKFCFTECQLKVCINNNSDKWILILLKKCNDDDILCTFKVISRKLKLERIFISDDSDWREMGSYSTNEMANFDIEVNVGIKTTPLLSHLVNCSLMDFEIKGIDGSVYMHGAVLAAASEVFRQMITNDFKEKKESRVELPYSVCVLQDLKDYIYLNRFNNDNLENLFMLANCYMMHDLRHICLTKMFSLSLKNMKENKDSEEGKRACRSQNTASYELYEVRELTSALPALETSTQSACQSSLRPDLPAALRHRHSQLARARFALASQQP